MFEKLFKHPWAVVRHKEAPFAQERERFLSRYVQEGYSNSTMKWIAAILLVVIDRLPCHPERFITPVQIKEAACRWAEYQKRRGRARHAEVSHKIFTRVATSWFRFLGRLQVSAPEVIPFMDLLERYTAWMREDRGLSPRTIHGDEGRLKCFLRWFGKLGRPFETIAITDVDRYLTESGQRGWCRVSISDTASVLRSFFRYAAMQNWCSTLIAPGILRPRIYRQENLPRGPAWEDVQRLLAAKNTDKPVDIRDRAILLLFAVYGLRCIEVANFRLEDIHWDQDKITIPRAKGGRHQDSPLVPAVGNAILRYLKEVRPSSTYREVFLTFRAPIKPMPRSTLSCMVSMAMQAAGISAVHRGPHALRHACATHLLAEGFSLKKVGDHLGHHGTWAVQTYAKVDLVALREVAAFDLGGVL